MINLTAERLRLRPFEKGDVETARSWVNDPETAFQVIRFLPVSSAEQEEWYHNIVRDRKRVIFAIELLDNDAYIGNTGLNNIDFYHRKAEFWIYIGDKNAQAKGYGTEATGLMVRYALESLNLLKIYLRVLQENERAVKVYKKIGFEIEGRLKYDVYLCGKYRDILLMAFYGKGIKCEL